MGSNESVLWPSDDSGDHWSLVSKDQEVDARPFSISHIEVGPQNPDHVLASSNKQTELKDRGKNFNPIAKRVTSHVAATTSDPLI